MPRRGRGRSQHAGQHAADVLCNGQRGFINCTRELLLKDGITLLPSAHTVVEVLETVEPDELVVATCQRLKAGGYTIALDDYVAHDLARRWFHWRTF